MRKYWKSVVIVLLVLAGLAWFALDLVKERAAMTGSASARVTKVAFDPDQESSSLDETDISYEYEVEAKRVASTSSLPGDRVKDFPVGREIGICYRPDDPDSSRINTDGGPCG